MELVSADSSIGDLSAIAPSSSEADAEIEAILDHSGAQDDRSYLVKWKNLNSSHNLWVHSDDFNDHSIITQYWNLKKGDSNRILDSSSFKRPVGRPKGSKAPQKSQRPFPSTPPLSSVIPKRKVGRPSKTK